MLTDPMGETIMQLPQEGFFDTFCAIHPATMSTNGLKRSLKLTSDCAFSPGGGREVTQVGFGWVCAARVSKVAPQFRNKLHSK